MEGRARRAPRKVRCLGWWTMHRVFPTNYGCSPSRSHATHTQNADYVGVLEEAAGLLDHAECHKQQNVQYHVNRIGCLIEERKSTAMRVKRRNPQSTVDAVLRGRG